MSETPSDEMPPGGVGNAAHPVSQVPDPYYRRLFETSREGILLLDAATARILDVNPYLVEEVGYARETFIGRRLWEAGPFVGVPESRTLIQELQERGGTRYKEIRLRTRSGERFTAACISNAFDCNGGRYIQCNIHDITERKASEASSRRQVLLYAALSQCNKAIMQCTRETVLFERICHIAVQFGGMKAAFIGVLDTATSLVRPVASFGVDEASQSLIEISIDPDSPYGQGPTGQALRENRPFWCNEIHIDKAGPSLSAVAESAGWASIAALPLHKGGAIFGALIVSSDTKDAFDIAVRRLLVEMAEDIGFALDNFAREARRRQAEERLRAAEEQFRGLVEQSIAGIYIVQDGKLVYANPRTAQIIGRGSADELIGTNPLIWVAEADRDRVDQAIRQLLSNEAQSLALEFGAVDQGGDVVQVGAHAARATHEGRPAVIGLVQDISGKKRAEEKIKHYVAELETALMSTIKVATIISEMRDPYTAGHERRVAGIAVAIGAELGFDTHRQEGLRVAGHLHDIGKITVPLEILTKPGKLSAIEYQLIKGHAQASHDVLKEVKFPWPVALVALQHHERMDGSGYPQGLKGDEILLEARIMAVADVVEAMASHRPYRPGLGIDQALAEIERGRATAYDAQVVDACLHLFREKDFQIPP